MARLSAWDWVALVLLVIGGLNWGLVGLFAFDLVAAIFGTMSVLSRIIYVLVGLSAIWIAIEAFRWRSLTTEPQVRHGTR
jgi:uncharacterized membrane protein YuzA (DUF378 family)